MYGLSIFDGNCVLSILQKFHIHYAGFVLPIALHVNNLIQLVAKNDNN